VVLVDDRWRREDRGVAVWILDVEQLCRFSRVGDGGVWGNVWALIRPDDRAGSEQQVKSGLSQQPER
jgi:hypothetical protein